MKKIAAREIMDANIRMSVGEYARKERVTVRTVYRRVKQGVVQYEQPAPHYPIVIVCKVYR